MNVAVVGSGPSGWAATMKLLSLGHTVTQFDSSVSDDDDFQINRPEMNKLNSKLLNGSDYMYRGFSFGPKLHQIGTNLASSFAESGLSLVWGATMLPYCQEDLLAWPINMEDLSSYYREISNLIPISGLEDKLTESYTLYISRFPLQVSTRILRVLENSTNYKLKNISVGASRLAVGLPESRENGCVYCSKCLKGCPKEIIWKTPRIVHPNLIRKSNLRVLTVQEVLGKVSLKAIDKCGTLITFSDFDKIFLGCGNIETFRILAESKIINGKVSNQDSATFFIPIWISKSFGKPNNFGIQLAQAFLRIKENDKNAWHLQLYEYSDDFIKRARNSFGLIRFVPKVILRMILKRFVIGIGYLDSQISPSMYFELKENGDVTISSKITRPIKPELKKLIKRNKSEFNKLGLKPFSSLVKLTLPGEGVHSGGWLPMGDKSDRQGRPIGSNSIHVIDSSVFPTIPAGSITFTVMANSMRIVNEACS